MNPWLEIPLEDYEAHMSLPSVAQAQFLADSIESLTMRLRPNSVAVVGCSGGNGFERISPQVVQRVVGIDINPQYVAEARRRYHGRFRQLEILCQDFIDEHCAFEPVDLVFAGLVFEYVDWRLGISSVRRFMKSGGYLSTVLQLPSEKVSAVSPSPFGSLSKLNNILTLVPLDEFEKYGGRLGFEIRQSSRLKLSSGKEFQEFLLKRKHNRRSEDVLTDNR